MEERSIELAAMLDLRSGDAFITRLYYGCYTFMLSVTSSAAGLYAAAIVLGIEFNPFMVVIILTDEYELSARRIKLFAISYVVGHAYWTLIWLGVFKSIGGA